MQFMSNNSRWGFFKRNKGNVNRSTAQRRKIYTAIEMDREEEQLGKRTSRGLLLVRDYLRNTITIPQMCERKTFQKSRVSMGACM